MPLHRHTVAALIGLTTGLLAACAPELDWREVRPAGSAVHALFPCKPSQRTRELPLAGAQIRLTLQACTAAGQTWGLAMADMSDPARVAPALAELARSASQNIMALNMRSEPTQVLGATPHQGSQRLWLQGQRPDGTAVAVQMLLFGHGTQVFQATALGERVSAEAAATFFDAIRVQP